MRRYGLTVSNAPAFVLLDGGSPGRVSSIRVRPPWVCVQGVRKVNSPPVPHEARPTRMEPGWGGVVKVSPNESYTEPVWSREGYLSIWATCDTDTVTAQVQLFYVAENTAGVAGVWKDWGSSAQVPKGKREHWQVVVAPSVHLRVGFTRAGGADVTVDCVFASAHDKTGVLRE